MLCQFNLECLRRLIETFQIPKTTIFTSSTHLNPSLWEFFNLQKLFLADSFNLQRKSLSEIDKETLCLRPSAFLQVKYFLN
jgi:hypothetical protein